MLDKRTEQLLSVITGLCGEDGFKVLSADELAEKLPKNLRVRAEDIADMVSFLVEREYVACKYNDASEFCLKMLPKGRLYEENAIEEKKGKFSYKRIVWLGLFGSFLGGTLGGVLAAFLMRIIG